MLHRKSCATIFLPDDLYTGHPGAAAATQRNGETEYPGRPGVRAAKTVRQTYPLTDSRSAKTGGPLNTTALLILIQSLRHRIADRPAYPRLAIRLDTVPPHTRSKTMSNVSFIGNLVNRFHSWREQLREADLLRSMSDRELSDLGLTRGDVERVISGTYLDKRAANDARRLAA